LEGHRISVSCDVFFSGLLNELLNLDDLLLDLFDRCDSGDNSWVLLKEVLLLAKSLGELNDQLSVGVNGCPQLGNGLSESNHLGRGGRDLGHQESNLSLVCIDDLRRFCDSVLLLGSNFSSNSGHIIIVIISVYKLFLLIVDLVDLLLSLPDQPSNQFSLFDQLIIDLDCGLLLDSQNFELLGGNVDLLDHGCFLGLVGLFFDGGDVGFSLGVLF